MSQHMRHGVEQHHAQQNQTDADNPNEIRFLPKKRYADQSRQNRSHACPNGACRSHRHGFQCHKQGAKHNKADYHTNKKKELDL